MPQDTRVLHFVVLQIADEIADEEDRGACCCRVAALCRTMRRYFIFDYLSTNWALLLSAECVERALRVEHMTR